MDHLWLFLLAALIVGASKGGLASAGTLAVPLLSIWMDPLMAAGTLLPIYIVSDGVGVWLYRHEYSRRNVLCLIPAGLVGVILAALLAPYLSVALATLVTGVIGLAYCLQAVVRRLRKTVKAEPFDARKGAVWGVLVGMTSFVSHTGAPPFQAFVLPQRLPKMQYAGTNTIVFAAVNLFKLPAYSTVGLLDAFEWRSFLAMAAVATVGAVLGRKLAQALPDRVYLGLIQAILFVLSVYLVAVSI
ncbi:MAG: sulfite exporter TauE/SafE family protein [Rhodospirillaceae bacterium]|nr:sulfite exporter TauE/SafE family protein [Rhodospirillaceae bacterium]